MSFWRFPRKYLKFYASVSTCNLINLSAIMSVNPLFFSKMKNHSTIPAASTRRLAECHHIPIEVVIWYPNNYMIIFNFTVLFNSFFLRNILINIKFLKRHTSALLRIVYLVLSCWLMPA